MTVKHLVNEISQLKETMRNLEVSLYSLLNIIDASDKIYTSVEREVMGAYMIDSPDCFYSRSKRVGYKKQKYTEDEKAAITVLIYILVALYKIPQQDINNRYGRRPHAYLSADANLGNITPISKILSNKSERETYNKILDKLKNINNVSTHNF